MFCDFFFVCLYRHLYCLVMPLNLNADLPAVELLKSENIFVMDSLRAASQDIRPLRICVLNLMPVKVSTEVDLVRLLSNSPLQLEVDWLRLSGHRSKNTSEEHLLAFYEEFESVRERFYDGMIVTGAPVEQLEFEEVSYWEELKRVMDWARVHVTSTLYICWGAQAALYHFYEVKKYNLRKKLFGVFGHRVMDMGAPLFRGFDSEFFVPHSRHSEIRTMDIQERKELKILSLSEEAGVYVVMSRGGREFYVSGHAEYGPRRLHDEFLRDLEKGLDVEMPKNYYWNNRPQEGVRVSWRGHANLLFSNWLNYFVYQRTPFVAEDIQSLGCLRKGDV